MNGSDWSTKRPARGGRGHHRFCLGTTDRSGLHGVAFGGRAGHPGEQFGEVESVKAVSPLYSPVSGEVIAVHEELVNHLDRLAQDPYGHGWLIKVRPSSPTPFDGLLDHQSYRKQCAH